MQGSEYLTVLVASHVAAALAARLAAPLALHSTRSIAAEMPTLPKDPLFYTRSGIHRARVQAQLFPVFSSHMYVFPDS